MTRAGLPVPPGFVVTVDAYQRAVTQTDIGRFIEQRLGALDPEDSTALARTADELQCRVQEAVIPDDVWAAIEAAYVQFCRDAQVDEAFVAVRSSGTVEDAAAASFAGMFRSFLNVHGAAALLQNIRACWASPFTARAISYRARQNLSGSQSIAVIVQLMVNAEKSGVLFTVDPATGNPNHLVIEGAWGLGEVVVAGQVTPDRYVVDKKDLRIAERGISRKEFMLTRAANGENERVELDDARGLASVLSDDEIQALVQLALQDEAHYGAPQDAEWAIANGTTYLVQTRRGHRNRRRGDDQSRRDRLPRVGDALRRWHHPGDPPARGGAGRRRSPTERKRRECQRAAEWPRPRAPADCWTQLARSHVIGEQGGRPPEWTRRQPSDPQLGLVFEQSTSSAGACEVRSGIRPRRVRRVGRYRVGAGEVASTPTNSANGRRPRV